jgi:hypothetical protein
MITLFAYMATRAMFYEEGEDVNERRLANRYTIALTLAGLFSDIFVIALIVRLINSMAWYFA